MSLVSSESAMSEDEVEQIVTPGSPITPDDTSPDPHIREDHITHSYQQKNTHTVTAKTTSRGSMRGLGAHAQTQTSIPSMASQRDARIHPAREVTHHEVSLDSFYAALFDGPPSGHILDDAKLLKDSADLSIRNYVAGLKDDAPVSEGNGEASGHEVKLPPATDDGGDAAFHLIETFRHIFQSARTQKDSSDDAPAFEVRLFPREVITTRNLSEIAWDGVVTDEPEGAKVADEPESVQVADEPESVQVTDEPESAKVADEPEGKKVSEDDQYAVNRPDLPEFAAVFRSGEDRRCSWNDFAFFVDPLADDFESQLVESGAAVSGGDSQNALPSAPTPSSHHHINPPTELLRCVEEAFSHEGTRRYVLGVTLDQKSTRLWYFDRAGSIRTEARDLDDKLMLCALLRLHRADACDLGREPFFEIDSDAPSPVHRAIGFEGKDSIVKVQDSAFQITSSLHSARELFGRGTAVFAARTLPAKSHQELAPLPTNVVVKTAWQPIGSGDEGEFLRLAAEKHVPGVITLYRSATICRLSGGMRARLAQLNHCLPYSDRELRVQVMGPLCIPLYRVTNIDHFKKAFKSLVEAHYKLYKATGILHHDISVNNLMVDAEDHSVGVLIDLDLAVRLQADNHATLPIKPAPPGTLPFRSIHVLHQGDSVRELFYRDDLESFLYSLVWILSYFRLPFSAPGNDLSAWYESDLEGIARYKTGFLVRPADTLPEGKLKGPWLFPLARLIGRGYMSLSDSSDAETMDGVLTYQSFMKLLE